MSEETAIEGWDSIARMFGFSKRAMLRRRVELRDAGAIFYRRKRGAAGHCYRVVCAFPSTLRAWQAKKTAMGEDV